MRRLTLVIPSEVEESEIAVAVGFATIRAVKDTKPTATPPGSGVHATKPATQMDVARIVGVSQRAVASVVGTGKSEHGGRVSESTRQRILEVAEAIGYRPHRGAQLIRGVRSGMIGLIRPISTTEHIVRTAVLLGEAVEAADFRIIAVDKGREPHNDARVIEFLYDFKVEGLLMMRGGEELVRSPAFDLFRQANMPTVLVENMATPPAHNLSCVYADEYRSGVEMVRHLIACGYQRIAMVADTDSGFVSEQERTRAYLDHLRLAGRPPDLIKVSTGKGFGSRSRSEILGQRGVARLLKRKRLPDAVICVNDMTALCVMAELQRHGVSIPGDLGLAGFDDHSLGRAAFPALTTVAYPAEQVAREAVRTLLAMIAQKDAATANGVRRALPTTLCPRESTRHLRSVG